MELKGARVNKDYLGYLALMDHLARQVIQVAKEIPV